MLAGPTGLHTEDQKIFYKEKEKDSRNFLDVSGIKDGSKLVLIEDEISREKRYLESRRNAKMENASKEITSIRLEIDKLAKQVTRIIFPKLQKKKFFIFIFYVKVFDFCFFFPSCFMV